MSVLTIILMNIVLAVILSGILALVMLSPRRLDSTAPGARPHRKIAVDASTQSNAQPRRSPRTDSGRRPLRPVVDR